MMFASGTMFVKTLLVGSTTRELGATPNVHIMLAPMQTCIGIEYLLLARSTFYPTIRAWGGCAA
jgi:hypothetical protein